MGLWDNIKRFINEKILRRKPIKVKEEKKLKKEIEEIEKAEDYKKKLEEKKQPKITEKEIEDLKEAKDYKKKIIKEPKVEKIKPITDKEIQKIKQKQPKIISTIQQKELEEVEEISEQEQDFLAIESKRKLKEAITKLKEAPTIKQFHDELQTKLTEDHGIITNFEGEDTIEAYNNHLKETIRNNLKGEDPKVIRQIINNLDKEEGRFTTIMTATAEETGETLEIEFIGKTIKNLVDERQELKEGNNIDFTRTAQLLQDKEYAIIKSRPTFSKEQKTITLSNVKWGTTFR